MRAAWYERQGSAEEVLTVGVMDAPQPAAGEVRIRLAASGINAGDVKKRQDAFAWAAAQPWWNGVLGTFGGSYLGCTQWQPARAQPPALRAMAPSITFSDGYEGCAYQGGAKVPTP